MGVFFSPCLFFWAAPVIVPKNGRRPEGLLPRLSRSPTHTLLEAGGGGIRANGLPALGWHASLSTGPEGGAYIRAAGGF